MEIESKTNRIQLLPEHLVDQIKAGEVVERPANVIKELIENSIDANPTEIKVTINNQGLDLIAIEDTGKGMFFDELPYAFCRHATSKITNFEDIYKLNTFGFRGEALASIASIARVSCHSTPLENLSNGGKIVIHGAQTIEHSPIKSDQCGTSLFIKDLFYNTPVRLKFVKSKVSEKNAIKRILNSFIVTNPQIKFSISIDDEDKLIYPVAESISNRVEAIFFGAKKNKGISEIENTYTGNIASIYVSNEATKGNVNKHQYLFINGRLFTDKKLHQIVIKNLEKFWGYGLSGHYVINLKVPESDIDVNVHPNKTLIKFLNEFEVFSLVSGSLKKLITDNADHINISSQDHLSFQEVLTNESELSLWQRIRNENHDQKNFGESFSEINSVSLGNQNLFENTTSERLTTIGHNIFFLEVNQASYFVNSQIVFAHFLKELESDPQLESSSLLISEPIDNILNKNQNENLIIDKLQNIGIEVDRIDETTLILRAIPYDLEIFNFMPIVKVLIREFTNGKTLEDIDYNLIPIELELMQFFYRKYGLIELIKLYSAKKLQGQEIKTKFYGKK